MSGWPADLLLFSVGLAAGFINVLAGGGSLITLPAMIFLGLPAPLANGTNRIGLVVQSLAGTRGFYRAGLLCWREALYYTLYTLPGAVLGALAGAHFGGPWFDRLLALLMICIVVAEYYSSGRRREKVLETSISTESAQRQERTLLFFLVLCGFYGGFIQAGAGIVLAFVFQQTRHIDLVRANALKVFIIGAYNIFSLITFALSDSVAWLPGIMLAVGSGVGAWLAVRLSVKKGQKWAQLMFSLLVAAMAIALLLR
ncbi:MAG: sulfite exporter TauE/SafE family protein [bacterium]|nr:sulfite exporter TauE/SafE family protein [bacterium]